MSHLGLIYAPSEGWSDVAFYARGRRERRHARGLVLQWTIDDLRPGPVSCLSAEGRLLGQWASEEIALGRLMEITDRPLPATPYLARRFVKVGEAGLEYIFKDVVTVAAETLIRAPARALIFSEGDEFPYTWPRDLLVPC